MTAERGGSAAPGFAATAICVPFVRHTLSNDAVEEVAKVKGLRHWWQLYVFGGDEVWQPLLERADRGRAYRVHSRRGRHLI